MAATALRPEDTLPTVNPRGGRAPVLSIGQVQGTTHVGNVRKANEDHFLVADLWRMVHLRQTSLPTRGDDVVDLAGTLLMVADGMGGHGDGDLASAVTLDAILGYAAYAMPWAKESEEAAQRAIEGFANATAHCQERLREVAARKNASQEMGTTLTFAYVSWPDVYVGHVGDSRCYVLRDGKLSQITTDHTLEAQMRSKLGRTGDLSQFHHILVNAVGGGPERPDVEGHRFRLASGDRLLLCSDGLHDEVEDIEIQSLLGSARSAGEACHSLISAALAKGGRDNVTAVVAYF
jgi:serine/threonine protein phosphatase PrpC